MARGCASSSSKRIRIRIVTRFRGRSLLKPSRLMGYDLVASGLCDKDSRGHSPFKAGLHEAEP
jgi:hypothetical protein